MNPPDIYYIEYINYRSKYRTVFKTVIYNDYVEETLVYGRLGQSINGRTNQLMHDEWIISNYNYNDYSNSNILTEEDYFLLML